MDRTVTTGSGSVATMDVTIPSQKYVIERSAMRELRTALATFDKAEYTGGRERASAFLAAVVRDALINFSD